MLPTTAPVSEQRDALFRRVGEMVEAAGRSGVNVLCLQEAWSEFTIAIVGCEKCALQVACSASSDAVRVLHPREASVVRVRRERRGRPLHQVSLAASQKVWNGHRQPYTGMTTKTFILYLIMKYQPLSQSIKCIIKYWLLCSSTLIYAVSEPTL